LACKRTRQSPPQPAAASRHNDNFIAQIRHLRKIPRQRRIDDRATKTEAPRADSQR
jgi:hypothetical protein